MCPKSVWLSKWAYTLLSTWVVINNIFLFGAIKMYNTHKKLTVYYSTTRLISSRTLIFSDFNSDIHSLKIFFFHDVVLAFVVFDIIHFIGYIEPVMVILHERELTWAGRTSWKHHTCMLSALSISTTLKQHPLIWSAAVSPNLHKNLSVICNNSSRSSCSVQQ